MKSKEVEWLIKSCVLLSTFITESWRQHQHCLILPWLWNQMNINFRRWIPLGEQKMWKGDKVVPPTMSMDDIKPVKSLMNPLAYKFKVPRYFLWNYQVKWCLENCTIADNCLVSFNLLANWFEINQSSNFVEIVLMMFRTVATHLRSINP